MKLRLIPSLLAALIMGGTAYSAPIVNKFGTDTEVCDPVLIYTGGLSKRATWNKINLRPYLTHLYADGHRDWFYDSFIFNETQWTDKASGETRVLINAGAGQLPATKANWEEYFDHLFAPSHDLAVLNSMIDTYRESIGEPRLRHKVMIGIPMPCKNGRGNATNCYWEKFDFGEIDGVDMDFSKKEHRIAAAEWAVDEVIRRFEEANFENIDLVGIYCAEETMYTVQDIMASINSYIHTKGLRTYWIPYWTNNNEYAHEWKKYGFNIAWRQPNYFFYERDGKLPAKSQLTGCITDSKTYGLGLELEFETSGTSNGMHETSAAMHQRLIDYIDAFEEYGVWDESGVAHYSGSKGLVDMAGSLDPVNQATIDRLADFVVKRQKAFAGISEPVVAEEVTRFAYAGAGEIFITEEAPEAVCYNAAGQPVHYGAGRFSCPAGLYIVTDGCGHSIKLAVR